MATSGNRAQDVKRAKGSNKCPKHNGKEVMFVCENCDDLVCADCVVNQHKGHALESLSNVIPEAIQKLQHFVKWAEETEIPQVKRKFKQVDEELSKNKKKFQKQVSEIKIRNESLKKELDKITDNMVKTCHDIEHENSNTLLNHQKELQTWLDKLNSKIKDAKASLQSGNNIFVFDTSHVIRTVSENFPTPSCRMMEFIPGKLPIQQLKLLLGKLNITDHNQPSLSFSQPGNWRVVSKFTPPTLKDCNVRSMHSAGDVVWLSDGSYTLLSVNQEGEVQQTLDTDVEVTDFSISSQTGNIWYCNGEDNTVREVQGSRESVKFETDTPPYYICVTRDDHILIGHDTEVVKYTQTGQVVCRTSGAARSIVRDPHHISECPLTGHIAVADGDSTYLGGNGKPFVCKLNDQLHLLHIYRGKEGQPSSLPFNPYDVHFTNTGELLITDINNRSVVLVTATASYLQTLYTNKESVPRAICVQKGALWVSMANKKINVLKNK